MPSLLLALFAPLLAAPPPIQLVESWPVETTLDHADIPDAAGVWVEMIRGARKTLDIGEFYITSEKGHAMEPVMDAIQGAARRGVKVRVLVDLSFYQKNYQADVDHLATLKGVEVRRWDVASQMGGVLHAKYFLVDGREAYVGSQNFDWRSLEHVYELGVRVQEPTLVGDLQQIYDSDWARAGGAVSGTKEAGHFAPVSLTLPGGPVTATVVASPTGFLPDEAAWDLPRLVALIDSAKTSVRVQLLNYKTTDPEGRYFAELESALRRAAARKVEVELLVSDWSAKKWTIEGLQSLECLPSVSVRMVSIPQAREGFIDFARTVHAKYLVVDGRVSWIGTSNWARDYFHESRNVGFIVDGPAFAAQLEAVFQSLWGSPYANEVDPAKKYEAPRITK